jgi:hypothetical protein
MKFRKIASILGGIALVGSTIAFAGAAALMNTDNFVNCTNSNLAVVYGAKAATSDFTASTNIGNSIANVIEDNTPTDKPIGSDFSSAIGVEEDIELGSSIVYGKIPAVLTDNKIPTLIDDKLSWDDGNNSDTTFNIHEEFRIGDVRVATSLDDNDFTDVALINDKGLSYRLAFEEDMATSLIGDDDADTLYLNILGKEYEVDSMDSNSITIVTSEEHVLKTGDTVVVDGVSLTIDAIGEDSISINGVIIDEGRTKKVNGLEVEADSVFYVSSGEGSLVVLKIGEDITTEYNSGDAYPGEDEDDPMWVWDISNPGKVGGWIGVNYDHRDTRAKDDGVKYVGESYEFPELYGAVNFLGLTDVEYGEYELTFIDEKDLWGATSNDAVKFDVPVVQIEGPLEESIYVNGKETDTLYLYYANNESGTQTNSTHGAIEIFYEDVNKDVSDSVRPRYVAKYALTSEGTLAATKVGELVMDDTTVDIKVKVDSGKASVILDDGVNEMTAKIGGTTLSDGAGALEYLGNMREDAEPTELSIDGKDIGTEDNNIVGYYGTVIKAPESNGDDDRIVMEIPNDKVEAKISIVGQGTEVKNTTTTDLPIGTDFVTKDTNVNSVGDDNIIVVGGSCINTVAAQLLGSSTPLCGEAFTAKTGVGEGQALIEVFQSPYNEEKVAILVAGYEAEDTTRAVEQVLDGTAGINLATVGERVIV